MAFPLLTTLALQNIDVLRAIEAAGPPATKAGLAKQLGRDKSNLNKTLDVLCEADLLNAGLDLTDRGRQALAAYDRAQGAGGDLVAPHAAFAPHPLNPRKDFASEAAAEALEALSRDIVERGQDHNIVVFPAGADGVFPIWKGERRWRAIGLAVARGDWPADRPIRYIVGEPPDAAARLIGALAENIQRENLNPIEEAVAFKHLRDVEGLKTDEIAAKISKTQRFVQLRIQLLDAPAITQVELAAGKITVQKALEAVQTKKAVDAKHFDPNPVQALILAEIAHKRMVEPHPMSPRAVHAGRSAQSDRDYGVLIRESFAMWQGDPAGTRLTLTDVAARWLADADLDPTTNPAALFAARQRAKMPLHAIQALEASGRYATDWLNVGPWKSAPSPSDEPAATYRGVEAVQAAQDRPAARAGLIGDEFSQQVRQVQAEAEDETAEMFPDAPRQDALPVAAPALQRDPYAHARRIYAGLEDDAVGKLVALEHDGDFDWPQADMPALADRMAFHFVQGDITGVAGIAAAMFARGGELFSERALVGAWRRALHRTFGIAGDESAKLAFEYAATGEIVDAEDGGLLATLEEGVCEEDGLAMTAGPELRRALAGLLAIRPDNWDDDEDPDSLAAWSYAERILALSGESK